LSWPMEPEGARAFAAGLEEVLVVEEKRPLIEDQLVKLLYNLDAPQRPRIIGKRDESGAVLMPTEGELSPTGVAGAIAQRLGKIHGDMPELHQRMARLEALERVAGTPATYQTRTPYFCSGCPHNSSTKVPEGSRAIAGIGCHAMTIWVPQRNTTTWTHMGGEGASWIGQAPFTSE